MTLTIFLHLFLLAVCISICAVIYMLYLPHDEPFSKWFAWGEKHFAKRWFYKPLFHCQMCFAGQCALWYYLYEHTKRGPSTYLNMVSWQLQPHAAPFWGLRLPTYHLEGYHLPNHIFFVCISILTTIIFSKAYNKIDRIK